MSRSISSSNIRANTIQRFHQLQGLACADETALTLICTKINDLNLQHRDLPLNDLKALNAYIRSIPSGRQRHLRRALDNTLYYLHSVCHWQLPKQKEHVLKDKELEWIVLINQQAKIADTLYQYYQSDKTQFLIQRPPINIALLALTLGISVAPLALSYLANILNTPNCIEIYDARITLKVFHPLRVFKTNSKYDKPFTRFALPVFAYRLLCDYQSSQPKDVTVPELQAALNTYTEVGPYYLSPLSTHQWHHCFQAFWYNQHSIPPTLLQDIAQPHRHVAFTPVAVKPRVRIQLINNIYTQDWGLDWFKQLNNTTKKHDWPHLKLIKSLKDKTPAARKRQHRLENDLGAWREDNILPKLFYLFTEELIRFGGIQADSLTSGTISKYTAIYKLLENYPLRYVEAIDPTLLQIWAHGAYDSLTSEDHQWLLYNFFRFLPHQALTEHIDLSEFESPTLPTRVDAFRINVSELDQIIQILLTQTGGTPFQQLCCSVVTLLGFYGALRRSEILRLRQRDIILSPDQPQQFRLCITNTDEGNTKNKQTRFVYIVMPEPSAKLIRVLLSIKQSNNLDVPLIGFNNESIHSRQLHYLLPVTRALKAQFGLLVRFHHLRHSGAHLIEFQGFHLAFNRPCDHSELDVSTQAMLTPSICQQRFQFWLEGRPFSQMNDGILLDVISQQLGHADYATTRLSYLHGVEWLSPFFIDKQQRYSHSEMRYLLALSATSNDLSRQLCKLSSGYAQANNHDKKQYALIFTEDELVPAVTKQRYLSINKKDEESNVVNKDKNKDDIFTQWFTSIPIASMNEPHVLNYQTSSLFGTLKQGITTFEAFSALWQKSGQHHQFKFTTSQQIALSKLGTISRNQSNELILSLCFNCNKKNAAAFNKVFRAPQWACFRMSFVLHQNRKSNKDLKLNILKTHIVKPTESVEVNTIAEGDTHLCVTLHFIPDSPLLFDYLFQFLTLNKDI